MTGISVEPASTGANLRSCCARARSWPTAIGSSASSWTRAPTPAGAPLSPGSREGRRGARYVDKAGHAAGRRRALAEAKELQVDAFGGDLGLAGRGNNGDL